MRHHRCRTDPHVVVEPLGHRDLFGRCNVVVGLDGKRLARDRQDQLRQRIEDLLQETGKALWKKFGDYDPSLPFLPWAKTFARYEVLNYLGRQRTRHKYFSHAMIELLAEDWELVEEEHDARILALESCVKTLPENSRRLLNAAMFPPLANGQLTCMDRR